LKNATLLRAEAQQHSRTGHWIIAASGFIKKIGLRGRVQILDRRIPCIQKFSGF
jgi:hypothetical protein